MEIQAAVPIMVAIMEAAKAISRVFISACRISSFAISSLYHLKVKPPHLERVLLALKERATKVAMGAYIKIIIKII